ncbi:unnamed protein product [Enterobius vermicularis]|uniref:ABC transmembrane type-1 domain-containing protein n=1 Tax=Enterobius vermicularis TaxID=51028 RepID=A0A0N4VGD2_ENTVE|nr:unnamed protein product [Enterobius vermicularis]
MYSALIGHKQGQFWHIFWTGSLMYVAKCLYSLHFESYSDQRITQDVERMSNQLAINILPNALIGPFVVAWYTWKTWQGAGVFGVAITYGYFVFGTIVNRLLMGPLAQWSARVEKAEGDFRYKHASIRVNAESSALQDADKFEKKECDRFLNRLLKIQTHFYCWRFPNYFWQQTFDYFGAILSYLIQYFPIFLMHSYSDTSPGDLAMIISNNAFRYIMLINSFTRVTDVALSAGEAAGVVQRVAAFLASAQQKWDEGLNLIIKKGENILVTGSTGIGKSSLFRVIAHLWKTEQGFVERYIDRSRIFHLPQRPYFPTGCPTLIQQLCFPDTFCEAEIPREEVNEILTIFEALKLQKLLDRCGGLDKTVDFEWQETLTPGEQQRLSFARMLYKRPLLAILDEATSSVDIGTEKIMYKLLQKVTV